MRLIDADALIDFVDVGHLRPPTEICFSELMMKNIIDIQPTIDAVPVRHGKWIPKMIKIGGRDYASGMKCSACGEDALDAEGDEFLTDYCPWCGARMVENG